MQVSHQFIEQAQEELDRGDVLQASEKGWGAAARAVKAAAEYKGWAHYSHALLHKNVDRLARETKDQELRLLFKSASVLHVNFYEGYQDREGVQNSLGDVRALVAKLERLVYRS